MRNITNNNSEITKTYLVKDLNTETVVNQINQITKEGETNVWDKIKTGEFIGHNMEQYQIFKIGFEKDGTKIFWIIK